MQWSLGHDAHAASAEDSREEVHGLGRGTADAGLLHKAGRALLAERQPAAGWVELDDNSLVRGERELSLLAAVLADRVGGHEAVVRDAVDSLLVFVRVDCYRLR